MKRFIFILGGARSGKSSYAVELTTSFWKKIAYIATCRVIDGEMKKRIRLHKKSRPQNWKLVEEGIKIDSALLKLNNKYEVVLVDCMGLFVSNLMTEGLKDGEIEKRIKSFIRAILKVKLNVIVVSNEVGYGIIPDNALARRFRDLLGTANQMMAKKADEVIFMQAGIPVKIKGGK